VKCRRGPECGLGVPEWGKIGVLIHRNFGFKSEGSVFSVSLANPYTGVESRPKRQETVNVCVVEEEDWVESCYSGVTHVSISTNVDVNVVVDGFETVAGASTITDGVVAECRPSVDSSQHAVGSSGNV
jgi:hypothetical protein